MSDNMSDMMQNISSMLNGKEIPADVQNMLNSVIHNSKQDDSNNNSNNTEFNINNDNLTTLLNNFNSSSSSSQKAQNTQTSENSNAFSGIDMETILKIQKIMNSMNSPNNSARANFLRSLKPYLKPSRQDKVEQYIQLLNMEKILGLINLSGGDKKDDT